MKKLIVLSVITLASLSAQAEVRINGFANLIGGVITSEDASYVVNGGLGYDDKISFSEESLFAIQVSGDINDKMTATAQLVARGENDYKAEFEWAYITYKATDKVSISAGRLRLPLFKYSASKDVGYSYHWITAPGSIYDVAFNNLDGIRVDYSTYVGDWEYNLQGALGTYSSEISTGNVIGDNVALFTAEAAYEWFKVRAVAGRGKNTFVSSDLDAALAGLTGSGVSQLVDLADDLSITNDTGVFLGFGIDIDTFDYFISAEITSVDIEQSFSSKDSAVYITAGARLGNFTPSITYEKLDGNQDIKFLDKVAALPAPYQPSVTDLVVGLQRFYMTEYDVVTLGIRYDMDTNVALKADIRKYNDDMSAESNATILRFAVNYVF
jgi:hypothetical protein